MYLRPVHTDLDLATLHSFIRSNPLGILTTAIKSSNYPLIQSSHIPFVLDIPEEPSTDRPGVLRGHLARANPQTKALIEAATNAGDGEEGLNSVLEEEVMVLFNGKVHHYVTPKFYKETKPSTGKVVPTWNYSAVQAYGTCKVYFNTSLPSTSKFISTQIDDLSYQSETQIFGYTGENNKPKPWDVSEAPEKYTALLMKAIIGIEIEITRIAGKFKMSQELGEGDREGTIEGFEKLGTVKGDEMAKSIGERAEIKRKEEEKKLKLKTGT